MSIRFNRLVKSDGTSVQTRSLAESSISRKSRYDRMVFMSHKTGDDSAEEEAKYIARKHGVAVYMAEWDDDVDGDTDDLPDHIMDAIRKSDGFLVNVVAAIRRSMWIGYEVGGAHAMGKNRAKIMYRYVTRLPSVVGVLRTLANRPALDRWIRSYVL